MPDVFISRQPLINRQNRILANRLSLHLLNGATPPWLRKVLAEAGISAPKPSFADD